MDYCEQHIRQRETREKAAAVVQARDTTLDQDYKEMERTVEIQDGITNTLDSTQYCTKYQMKEIQK